MLVLRRRPFSLCSMWKTLMGNKDFPEKEFYLGDRPVTIEIALFILRHLEQYERLNVEEVRLYKEPSSVAHEFLAYDVMDIEARHPTQPIAFHRMDRYSPINDDADSMGDSERNAAKGETTFSMANTRNALLENIPGGYEQFELSVVFKNRVDPMKILYIGMAVVDVASEYIRTSRNCYFFSQMVIQLSVDLLGGEIKKNNNKAWTANHFIELPFLEDEQHTILLEKAKKIYEKELAVLETTRENMRAGARVIEFERIAEERRKLREDIERENEDLKRQTEEDVKRQTEDAERRAAEARKKREASERRLEDIRREAEHDQQLMKTFLARYGIPSSEIEEMKKALQSSMSAV